MYSPCKLTKTFLANWASSQKLLGYTFIYSFKGHLAKLTSIDKTEDGYFKFHWTSLEDNTTEIP